MKLPSKYRAGVLASCIAISLALGMLQQVKGGTFNKDAPPPGWFHVFSIDRDTYAISEPMYWQQNVSYLLLGTKRALLFDTGPGIYGIRKVVESITKLPLVVIPSHLHFDHVGNLNEFDTVELLDAPALRAQVHNGYFTESATQFMLSRTETFRVHGWLKDRQIIELGNRPVTLVSTPGHTPDSVSLVDASRRRMFSGDLVNRLVTLCDVPGSDIHAMANSLHELISLAPGDSPAYEAHAEIPLQPLELKALATGVVNIANGNEKPVSACLGGLPMKRYDIGAFPILLPADGSRALPPLSSATETLDWLNGACDGNTR
jgi:glyoxylase-like metal-dependent hydrolase (beta-lactamase superfamily II)